MKAISAPPGFSVGRRWVGFLLFCSIFFLPFHFHFTGATPQVTKECCCLQGTRTQAGPLEDSPVSIPASWIEAVIDVPQTSVISCIVVNHLSRAPPVI
jgi:hypothetical protein